MAAPTERTPLMTADPSTRTTEATHGGSISPPIHTLPDELLIEIFRYANRPDIISGVCRKWAQIIVSYPDIYRDAVIHLSRDSGTRDNDSEVLQERDVSQMRDLVRNLMQPTLTELRKTRGGRRFLHHITQRLNKFSFTEKDEALQQINAIYANALTRETRRKGNLNRCCAYVQKPLEFKVIFVTMLICSILITVWACGFVETCDSLMIVLFPFLGAALGGGICCWYGCLVSSGALCAIGSLSVADAGQLLYEENMV